jgi:hypothetical protein
MELPLRYAAQCLLSFIGKGKVKGKGKAVRLHTMKLHAEAEI